MNRITKNNEEWEKNEKKNVKERGIWKEREEGWKKEEWKGGKIKGNEKRMKRKS